MELNRADLDRFLTWLKKIDNDLIYMKKIAK